MSLIVAENVSKHYQVAAIKVSKDYQSGEIVVQAWRLKYFILFAFRKFLRYSSC